MGIPDTVPTAISYLPRVVVKFSEHVQLPYSAQAQDEIKTWPGHAWDELLKKFPGISLGPYFNPTEKHTLDKLQQRAAAASGHPSPRLTAYYVISIPLAELLQTQSVAAAVSAWPQVEIAYVEFSYFGPELLLKQAGPWLIAPPKENLEQGYCGPGPIGIGATWAREIAGLDGAEARIVDLENGWLLHHEDLPHHIPKIGPGMDSIIPGHGAAVLGILVGLDDNHGVVGIAPRASLRIVSQCFAADWGFAALPAAAIYLALRADMKFGDVLLLETASVAYDPKLGSVPVETQALIFDLIRTATDLGITVVAPAGTNFKVDANGFVLDENGHKLGNGQNLDEFRDSNNNDVLNRHSQHFKDSGAILVGAAWSTSRARFPTSNYGSRVDCYAWGNLIATCGDGWAGLGYGSTAPEQIYTIDFGGTSGATAIVAGAAVLLQQASAKSGRLLDPATMRALLMDPNRNTPSQTPAIDRIGVMPDLRRLIIPAVLPELSPWSASLKFAFGDKGGDGDQWSWTPSSGLHHVGPWGPDGPIGPNTRLSGATRDVLIGLVLSDVASLLNDQTTQKAINDAVGKLLPIAVDRRARPAEMAERNVQHLNEARGQ